MAPGRAPPGGTHRRVALVGLLCSISDTWQLHSPTRFLKDLRDQYRSRGPAQPRAMRRAGQAGTWPEAGRCAPGKKGPRA